MQSNKGGGYCLFFFMCTDTSSISLLFLFLFLFLWNNFKNDHLALQHMSCYMTMDCPNSRIILYIKKILTKEHKILIFTKLTA